MNKATETLKSTALKFTYLMAVFKINVDIL